MTETIIPMIYEAAVLPEKWPAVMDQVARQADGVGASLITAGARPMRWIATPVIDTLIRDCIATGNLERNNRISYGAAVRHAGFLAEHDAFTGAELDNNPFFTDFLRPRGFGWCAGTTVVPPTDEVLIFSVEKRFDHGPMTREAIQRLDMLRPHLARAALMSSRLQLERTQTTVAALEMVGLPAAMLGATGKVLAMNAPLTAMTPQRLQDRTDASSWLTGGGRCLAGGSFGGIARRCWSSGAFVTDTGN